MGGCARVRAAGTLHACGSSDGLDIDPPLPALARDSRAGLGRATLDGPGFRRLLYGVLVAADVPDTPRLRVEGGLGSRFFDSAFASHAKCGTGLGCPRSTRLPASM